MIHQSISPPRLEEQSLFEEEITSRSSNGGSVGLRHKLSNSQKRRLTPSQILGTTYTGEYEDVKAINDILIERNLDTPIHVDAASGGFVAPFVRPAIEWDFRLPRVVSINASGHKYGLVSTISNYCGPVGENLADLTKVYPGVGWVVWRDPKYLDPSLVFHVNVSFRISVVLPPL